MGRPRKDGSVTLMANPTPATLRWRLWKAAREAKAERSTEQRIAEQDRVAAVATALAFERMSADRREYVADVNS